MIGGIYIDFSTNDNLTTAQIIKAITSMKGLTVAKLAALIDTSRQNLSGKLTRDNLSEKELREIAAALGYDIEIRFIERKGSPKP